MMKFTGLYAAVVAILCATATAQTVKLKESMVVGPGQTFDGGGKTYVSDGLGDGGQSEGQDKLFRLEDGATLKNVRIGFPAADGVRVLGDATFINVHWDDVGEDAMSIGAVCADTQHTVVLDGCSMAKAADKAFQVNARAQITMRNFEAHDIHRFLKAGVPVTVTIEDSLIMGGADSRYFIRASSPSSMVYMKNTKAQFNKNTMLFYDMDPKMYMDEGGNQVMGADGGPPVFQPRMNDECGFDGGQPGGGAKGTMGSAPAAGVGPPAAAGPAGIGSAPVAAEDPVEDAPVAAEDPVEDAPVGNVGDYPAEETEDGVAEETEYENIDAGDDDNSEADESEPAEMDTPELDIQTSPVGAVPAMEPGTKDHTKQAHSKAPVGGSAAAPAGECLSIEQFAESTPELATLATAVYVTPSIADKLSGLAGVTEDFTLFAPSNAAWDVMPADALDALLGMPDILATLLQGHIVPGAIFSMNLMDGDVLDTINGQQLTVSVIGGTVFITAPGTGGYTSAVSQPDMTACNGVIHVMDTLLLPNTPPTDGMAPMAAGGYADSPIAAVTDTSMVIDTTTTPSLEESDSALNLLASEPEMGAADEFVEEPDMIIATSPAPAAAGKEQKKHKKAPRIFGEFGG